MAYDSPVGNGAVSIWKGLIRKSAFDNRIHLIYWFKSFSKPSTYPVSAKICREGPMVKVNQQ